MVYLLDKCISDETASSTSCLSFVDILHQRWRQMRCTRVNRKHLWSNCLFAIPAPMILFQQTQRKPILKLNQLMIFFLENVDLWQIFHPFSIHQSLIWMWVGIIFPNPDNCTTQAAIVHPNLCSRDCSSCSQCCISAFIYLLFHSDWQMDIGVH